MNVDEIKKEPTKDAEAPKLGEKAAEVTGKNITETKSAAVTPKSD